MLAGKTLPLFLFVAIACASAEDDGPVSVKCVPGEQSSCACPGGLTGVQVCESDGTYGACSSCGPPGSGGTSTSGGSGGLSGSGGTSGGSGGATGGAGGTGGVCSSPCSNGLQDCGETGVDCGGPCAACPPAKYVIADCWTDTPRNGSEDCDDGSIPIPSSPPVAVLVCLNAKGGVNYLATNTGPAVGSDPVQRCDGWEKTGLKAADNLNYIAKLTCDAEQKTLVVDLSAYAGKTIYVGAHTQAAGTGHGTIGCVAKKK